ncbi:Vacuolar protein sorting-associated protein 45 [Thelohanellus kitauei]|uniref:Vacuolar protein sorting-associated protein 45 n=1 Tax=Thelohanellus kitauei TaxID=669202 RepID=A0A0C2NA79_THEKT|nr:Vacuolar protein sorting-associated protein 45 [Thelohanellus kitauei]
MSLKLVPDIKFFKNSTLCEDLANHLFKKLSDSIAEFDDFNVHEKTLLIIIDRRIDPLSPLLLPWTYQAMVHETFTLKNNIIHISSVPDSPNEISEINLSSESDGIFQKNMHASFSELAKNIQEMLSEYQALKKDHQKTETIQDIKNIVDSLPKFQKVSSLVSKHINIASDLNNTVKNLKHPQQSEFEQNMMEKDEKGRSPLNQLLNFINDPEISNHDSLRLSLIYFIKHPKIIQKEKDCIFEALTSKGIKEELKAVEHIINYSQSQKDQSILSNMSPNPLSSPGRYLKNIVNADRIGFDSGPCISEIIKNPIKHNLLAHLPPLSGTNQSSGYLNSVFFVIGGFTYKESREMNELQRSNHTNLYLGGTWIHNSKSFIEEILDTYQN